MQYTITSHGRPIGVTDLGFRYREGPSRMGWFHPNAEGEPLMPVITAAPTASHTYASDGGRTGDPASDTERDNTFLADLAEASQHVDALELELRRDDGSVVQTEFISVQDVDELVAWSDKLEAVRDRESWKFGDAVPDPLYDPTEDLFDEELDGLEGADPEFELQGEDDVIFGDGLADTSIPWSPDEYEPDPSMRYQIYVSLVNPADVP